MATVIDGCGYCGCCAGCSNPSPCENGCDEAHTFNAIFINQYEGTYQFCIGVPVYPCIGVCPNCLNDYATFICCSFVFYITYPLDPRQFTGDIAISANGPGSCVATYHTSLPEPPWDTSYLYTFCIKSALRGPDICCQSAGTIGVQINYAIIPL